MTGEATLEDAIEADEQGRFTPFGIMVVRGFVTSPMWLRLDLPLAADGAEIHVLRIRRPWHDEVRLFDYVLGGPVARVSGDRYPVPHDGYPSLDPNFLVPQLSELRTAMVRLDTPCSIIFSMDDVIAVDQRRFTVFMGYLAPLVFMIANTLGAWLGDRERLLGIVSLTFALGILHVASMYGVLRVLLDGTVPAGALDRINDLLIIAYLMATIWFYRGPLTEYALNRFARHGLEIVVVVVVVNLVLILLGHAQVAFLLNAVNIIVSVPWVFAAMVFGLSASDARADSALPLWLVRLVSLFALLITLIGVARTLGFLVGDGMTIKALPLHALVMSVVMGVGLQYLLRQRRHPCLLPSSERNMGCACG